MFVADPSGPALSTILWTMLGGYLAAGGAGAINHYVDRDRDARMARTRGRPLVAGRIEPLHGLVFGIALGALATVQLALTVNVLSAALALAGLLGYVFVYTVWLKPLTPQNIVIGGAAGRGAAAGRLGGGDRRARARGAVPVRDRLPLDAAPLLGALAADQGRLRAHRGADAAGGQGRAGDPPPDPRLHADPRRLHPAAGRDRLPRRASTSPRRWCSAAAFTALAVRAAAHARRAAPRCASTCPRSPTWPCSSARWPRTGPSDRTAAMDRNRAAANIGSGLATASIAIGVFGLCFFVAIVYIG